MADGERHRLDELGATQTFAIEVAGNKKTMRDAALNIETFDFRFRDPEVLGKSLPGTLIGAAWSKAAVSAHVNAAAVATFLRDVLKRNNIDNKGGKLISTVNCVVKRDERPAGSKNWLNAFWDGKQMVYGQVDLQRRAALARLLARRRGARAVSRRDRPRPRASSIRPSPAR